MNKWYPKSYKPFAMASIIFEMLLIGTVIVLSSCVNNYQTLEKGDYVMFIGDGESFGEEGRFGKVYQVTSDIVKGRYGQDLWCFIADPEKPSVEAGEYLHCLVKTNKEGTVLFWDKLRVDTIYPKFIKAPSRNSAIENPSDSNYLILFEDIEIFDQFDK